jgi:hypothetical protein
VLRRCIAMLYQVEAAAYKHHLFHGSLMLDLKTIAYCKNADGFRTVSSVCTAHGLFIDCFRLRASSLTLEEKWQRECAEKNDRIVCCTIAIA